LRSFHALFKFLYCAAINELDSGHPFAAGMAVSLTLRTRTARVADNFNGCVDDIEIAFEHILNESRCLDRSRDPGRQTCVPETASRGFAPAHACFRYQPLPFDQPEILKERRLVIALRQGKTVCDIAADEHLRGHASISRQVAKLKARLLKLLH